jgi:Skp family chaperone for outer membrane proteins
MTKFKMVAALGPGMAAALLAGTSLAQAARPAPAAAAPAVNWGAPITGLCVLSRDAAVGGSSAGASASSQLKQLTDTANASLVPEAQAIKTEQQSLRSQASTLTQAALQQRSSALNQRIQAYQDNAQTKNKQLSQAQTTAITQIEQQIGTLLPSLVNSHRCSVILERGGTYGANPAMDLTQEVITQLNAKLPSVSVTLPPVSALQR